MRATTVVPRCERPAHADGANAQLHLLRLRRPLGALVRLRLLCLRRPLVKALVRLRLRSLRSPLVKALVRLRLRSLRRPLVKALARLPVCGVCLSKRLPVFSVSGVHLERSSDSVSSVSYQEMTGSLPKERVLHERDRESVCVVAR